MINVGLHVEIAEERNEGEHVNDERIVHPEREIAPRPNSVDAQNHRARELDHLQDGQVLLPPQVLRHLWSEYGQAVIRVHQDVDG